MSRCFPYPPPGYVRNPVAVAEAETTAKVCWTIGFTHARAWIICSCLLLLIGSVGSACVIWGNARAGKLTPAAEGSLWILCTLAARGLSDRLKILTGMTCSRDWLPQIFESWLRDWLPQIFESWLHGYHVFSKKNRITNLIQLLRVDLVHSISPEIAWDYMRDPCKFGMPKLVLSHFLFVKSC